MFKTKTSIRVRYSETDKMGYVYYGNYAAYFEVARVDTLRELGISYKEMEDSGTMLPVLEYSIKYYKPAFYDELLTIETEIRTMPGVRITFHYKTINASGVVLNEAHTTLVFINMATNKPMKMPTIVADKFSPYFQLP